MGRFLPLLMAAPLSLGACMEEHAIAPVGHEPIVHEMVGIPAAPGEAPRGIYLVTEEPETTTIYAPMHRIIYLNYDGGTFTPGSNNSSTNRSTIPSFTASVSPWGSSSQRAAVTDCIEDLFSPFNVTITTTDPGDTTHIESVIAGRPQDVGMQSGVGGVSPFSCGIIERSIVFTFAEVYGSSTRAICETAAQEIAHSFGLDHEYLCEDPMTYLSGCGAKAFRDVDAQCGEFSPRACQCGGSTQNSVELMLAALGPAGSSTPPTVSITDPVDGATVDPGFSVRVNATDDVAVERVEIEVDGALVATLTGTPYVYDTDPSLAPGVHTIEAIAYDASDAATASINVTVNDAGDGGGGGGGDGGGGDGGGDGGGGGGTGDGTGETGDACETNEDCLGGMCLTNGTENYCSRFCDPADASSCPAGLECTTSTESGDGVCWPSNDGGGNDIAGGCSSTGAGGGALGGLLALLALSALCRRRD